MRIFEFPKIRYYPDLVNFQKTPGAATPDAPYPLYTVVATSGSSIDFYTKTQFQCPPKLQFRKFCIRRIYNLHDSRSFSLSFICTSSSIRLRSCCTSSGFKLYWIASISSQSSPYIQHIYPKAQTKVWLWPRLSNIANPLKWHFDKIELNIFRGDIPGGLRGLKPPQNL